MRPAISVALLVLAVLLGGCGSSDETTGSGTVTGPENSAQETQKVRMAWQQEPSCERPAGASRWGCSVGSYRCQAVVVDRGWAVSCSKPGRSLAFTIPRD